MTDAPEAPANEATRRLQLRFGLVRESGASYQRLREQAWETERDHTGEAGHEAASEVGQESGARAVLEAILKTVGTPEAVLEAILKTIRTSRHHALIDYRAAKSGREPGMEAWLHPVGLGHPAGHPVGHSASETLCVSLAGTS
jgi:hypothetical protein